MSAPTTDSNKKTNDSTPAPSSESEVEHVYLPGQDGEPVVDTTSDEDAKKLRLREPAQANESGSDAVEVFAEGYASEEYIEGLRKGFVGVEADELDNEHYTVAGVTADPQIAADHGRVQHEDVADRANRQYPDAKKKKAAEAKRRQK